MLAVNESGSGTPLILLHGWGLHSGVWQSVLPELEKQFHCYAVDMLGHGESQGNRGQSFSLEAMRKQLQQLISRIESDNIILLGWSLGGLVAMDYLSLYPESVEKLILVTSNACFCKKPGWSYGLDIAVLDSFATQLEQDYKKTVDKFMALQMFGADDYRQSLKILKASISSRATPSIEALRNGLDILKNCDLTTKLNTIEQPVLMITAEHDRLMPYQAAEAMQPLFKNAQCEMIQGAGHAPFISHPQQFMQALKEYCKEQAMSEPDFYVNKALSRRAFENAAANYDEAAVLQREVASRLVERLDYMLIKPKIILDAGAGTGYCSLDLVKRYPDAQVIALDIAQAMLRQTRQKSNNNSRISCLSSDVEQIALADNSVDLIVSSLTVQWCNDYIKAFEEFKRVLKPGGCILFTSFGPDALKELRHCWYKVDNDYHVNSFIDMHHIGDILLQAGFADPVMDTENITVTYKDVYQIMRDLKTIGAHNVLNGRRHSLTGKKRLQAMVAEYETFRSNGVVPMTYEIVYGHAWMVELETVNVDFNS